MKTCIRWLGVALVVATPFPILADDAHSSQVFFRGAFSSLITARGGEVFTDTLATSGTNDRKGGLALSAGVDLALTKENAVFDVGTLLGQVYMEYARFSDARVIQTTSALLGGTNKSNVSVTQMTAAIAPKLRIDAHDIVRPFVIPGGMAWLVNSPPSDDTTYLDFGIPFAVGVDFKIMEQISAGVDFRYTYAFDLTNTHNSTYSVGGYAGINF